MNWKDVLGTNILDQRTQRGWSQQDLAGEAELSIRYVGGIERGEENPSLETIVSLSDALEIPVWKLLYPR